MGAKPPSSYFSITNKKNAIYTSRPKNVCHIFFECIVMKKSFLSYIFTFKSIFIVQFTYLLCNSIIIMVHCAKPALCFVINLK